MDIQQFEDTLRLFTRGETFQPFVVEMLDGSLIEVDNPGVVFGFGAAGFISRNDELVDFRCENVRAIRQAAHEAAP